MNKPLRGIQKQTRVCQATEIPLIGFGGSSVTQRTSHGIVTQVLANTFQMSCGCMVRSQGQCGSPCPWCWEEILQILQETPASLTDEQVSWAATPCARHFHPCAAPFCGQGGCTRHIALGLDRRRYCRMHFEEVHGAAWFAELRERRGLLAASTARFFKSLFFNGR